MAILRYFIYVLLLLIQILDYIFHNENQYYDEKFHNNAQICMMILPVLGLSLEILNIWNRKVNKGLDKENNSEDNNISKDEGYISE